MKKKYLYLLIAGLALTAILPIVILLCFSAKTGTERPQTVV